MTQKALTYRNFPNLVGYDRLFDELDRVTGTVNGTSGYPPYNVIADNTGTKFVVEVAVAGFGKDDLKMTEHNGNLTIAGEVVKEDKDDENVRVVHRGISARKFERTFKLAQHVKVERAVVENGLLTISLVREVPEALQPKQIKIDFKG